MPTAFNRTRFNQLTKNQNPSIWIANIEPLCDHQKRGALVNIAAARDAWANDGIARIPNYVSQGRCEAWTNAVDVLVRNGDLKRKVYETPKDPVIFNDGGLFDHYILDGIRAARLFPDMQAAYEVTRIVIAEITKLDIVTSPHPLSAININRYDAPTGSMSAHFDSNPISVVLYLTDNPTDGATVFLREQECRWEYPRTGDLLVFRGREIKHLSKEVRSGVKVAALWNFYTQHDQHRPPGMDKFMYEYDE